MARTKRYNVSLDKETIQCIQLWRQTGVSGSQIIREAVIAYTKWKKPQPPPESFDSVDLVYEHD